MSIPSKISPLRHLVNVLSDAVDRIDEKYASANLEFPTLDVPFDRKEAAYQMLSDPDVVPLSSVIVAAADQLIVSARHPSQAVLDMVQFVSAWYYPSSRVVDGLLLDSTLFLRALDWRVSRTFRRSCAKQDRRSAFIYPLVLRRLFIPDI
jgi:hypothetical protein